MSKKKVLVPGGTGAMGVYLIPELLHLGYAVDVVSLDDIKSDNPDLRYFKANFKDPAIRAEFLKNDYDAIVDFMIYGTEEFRAAHHELLTHCGHSIYLSTSRARTIRSTRRAARISSVSPDARTGRQYARR